MKIVDMDQARDLEVRGAALARDKACFEEAQAELNKLVLELSSKLSGYSGRFANANFSERGALIAKLAFINNQMVQASHGAITWTDARDNVFALSSPSWMEGRPELVARVTAIRDRPDFFQIAKDICRPPAIRGRVIPLATMGQVNGNTPNDAA